MSRRIGDVAELATLIAEAGGQRDRYVVAISGFGGAGKTTVSGQLAVLLDATVIHLDDFIAADQNGAEADFLHDWDKFEELTLQRIRTDDVIVSRIYDWPSNRQVFETLDIGKYVIVEGSPGLIQERFLNYFHLTVWIDVPADIAHARGKRRDRDEQQVDHDELWDTVWGPMELTGFDQLRPDLKADVLLSNGSKR